MGGIGRDAGLSPQKLTGSPTGVFVGICSSDYHEIWRQDPTLINAYSNAGVTASIAANRISYLFDFRGPSFSIDTACSSSLVALHLACESLRKSECQLALVGAVGLILNPYASIGFAKAQMLSARGKCRAFDAEADGYVRGEGAGVVVLKPLSQAVADRDPLYAVIRATGINQDGRTSSLYHPSRAAQEDLLRSVYARAGISPRQVHYVEAHRTGTPVGDTTECFALGAVFCADRSEEQPLRIGSVKTNIGHLEGASGIAGLMKAALILKYRQLPANVHFQIPNPAIPFKELHLEVQQKREALPEDDAPLFVGVNSFGFGGTNAHAVLQAVTPSSQSQTVMADNRAFLLPISARSPETLRALAQSYLEMLRTGSAPALQDLCFTASIRRDHHIHRLALVARSHAELVEKLEAFLVGEKRPGIATGYVSPDKRASITFVFSGNGPQWWAMGRQLFEQEPIFRKTIEECDRLLQPYTDWSLTAELLAEQTCSRMHLTTFAQPALFALQVALVALWRSWGISPQAVIGHSVGEIAAACVAGILSFEDLFEWYFIAADSRN